MINDQQTEPSDEGHSLFDRAYDDNPPPREPASSRVAAAARHAVDKIVADPLRVLLPAIPVVVYAIGAWVHRYITEDGFINFHIVQHISAGNGPVFNAGERVEAYTSPLWLFVLAVLRLLFGRFLPLQNIAVLSGLALSIAALVFAMLAAMRLARLVGPIGGRRSPAAATRPLVLPAGAIVWACSPFMWRWATSGLETSLTFFWIAFCSWGLIRRYPLAAVEGDSRPALPPPDRPRWYLVAIGLGPLVRPEFVVYAACFFVAVWLTSTTGWRAWLRSLAWMLGIPVAYQIFRMGYFGALLPNTALAKNSDASLWARGTTYAQEFLGREWLWIALAVVALLLVLLMSHAVRSDRRVLALYGAPLAGAFLNVLFVQRVGGDYMYARFYLPAFVAVLVPVAVVVVPRPRAVRFAPAVAIAGLLVLATVAWSVGASINGKLLDANTGLIFGDYGMLLPGQTNPVNPEDYGFLLIAMEDGVLRKWGANDNVLYDSTDDKHPVIPLRPGQGIVVKAGAIGVTSYVAGPDVWIVDDRGLADAIAGRLVDNKVFPIPGHEKLMSWDYVVARWAPPQPDESEDTKLAREAFQCPPIRELVEATTEPMSVGRFLKNIAISPRLTSLRISADATKFKEQACGG